MLKRNKNPDAGPFVVATTGADGQTLFLVDRSKDKNRWWTTELDGPAMLFVSYLAALVSQGRLKHNNPRVLNMEEAALEWEKNKSKQPDPHPFSEDAFSE